ncbi:hypothetical protein ACEZDB_18865 [Streptacidiphilus sp. N1-3]|uniref:Uncharacterized protein n=1 Tax=Streptacidiphilus alkalitolerans TaxID=3342712 RepID=A0ABV6X348_9ACTN
MWYRYRLEANPGVRQWLRELCAAEPRAAGSVGAAVTALLAAGTGLGEPLVVPMASMLPADDPESLLDHAYQDQLRLLQQVRRGIADISTGRAGPPEAEQRLTRLSQRLQQEVDRLRTSKEVAKAVYNVGRLTVELDAYLTSRGATGLIDPIEPVDPESASGIAAAQAGIDDLLATAQMMEREVRTDPFLADRLSPASPALDPTQSENLHVLRPGAGDGGDEIRIVFAVAPGRTVVLLTAEQGQDDLWLWHQQALQAAEAWWSGRRTRAGGSGRSFLREFFPGRTREIRADAARLLIRIR